MIGGLIPLSEDCSAKSKVDKAGIAVVEAIDFALTRMATDTDFNSLKTTIGYDIHDTCNDAAKQKDLAYVFSVEKSNKQITGNASIKTAEIIMAPFEKDSLKALKILNIEEIPQISYSAKNARLIQDGSVPDEDITLLASTFPDQTNKVRAVSDIVSNYKFAHVYIIGSDDAYGKSGVSVLSDLLAKGGVCSADAMSINGADSIKAALDTIQKNPRIKVVVLHCSDHDAAIFEEAKKRNMTDFVFITTYDWKMKSEKLLSFGDVVDGLIFVNSIISSTNPFNNHIQALKRPYKKKKWLEKLFVELGGNTKNCYNLVQSKENKKCNDADVSLKEILKQEANNAQYAIDAVYALANAVMKKGNKTLVESLTKQDEFTDQYTKNRVNFNGGMASQSYKYELQNVRKNEEPKIKRIGEWNLKSDDEVLEISQPEVRWKEGDKTTPISQCNDDCGLGTYRTYLTSKKCCWTCKQCPEGLASNVTNAAECFECPFGYTANPDQKSCEKYKIKHFHWFDAMGQFMIFLMVFGVCVAMFSLGILSQNSEHAVVKAAGYKCMCLFILGAVLCFLSPIPLLVTPTVQTCSSYIGLFNVALTIPIAVLISKSAIITENYFDEEGDCIKPTLGPRPRAVVILIVVAIQLIIVITGAFIDPPLTLHNDIPGIWNEKFAECSCYLNFTFWIAFGYNIAISVICQFLSCGSTKCDDNFGELRSIISTLLWFYLAVLIEISLIYREVNKRLAEAQAVMCVIFGFFFLLNFAVPKVYTILFKTKPDGTVIEDDPRRSLLIEEKDHVHPTAIHAADGFKNHGIIQMRINEEDEA